jgi:hypothetical protein
LNWDKIGFTSLLNEALTPNDKVWRVVMERLSPLLTSQNKDLLHYRLHFKSTGLSKSGAL